jgi:hypothetical protein
MELSLRLEQRNRRTVMRAQGHYDVHPRYSCGSPAMVPEHTARGVAEDERRAYEAALTGFYGEAEQEKAKQLGLAGIVEYRTEKAKYWLVEDLITGRVVERLFWAPADRCKKCGQDVQQYQVTKKKRKSIMHTVAPGINRQCPGGELRPHDVEREVGH